MSGVSHITVEIWKIAPAACDSFGICLHVAKASEIQSTGKPPEPGAAANPGAGSESAHLT